MSSVRSYPQELDTLSLAQLQQHFDHMGDFYSDLYKDRNGMRPRTMALCADQYATHADLKRAAVRLNILIEAL